MAGQKITIQNGVLQGPDFPLIPFIEGDGTGPDLSAASVRVFAAAAERAYNGHRKMVWKEVYPGHGCPGQRTLPSRNTWWPSSLNVLNSALRSSTLCELDYSIETK